MMSIAMTIMIIITNINVTDYGVPKDEYGDRADDNDKVVI